MGACGMHGLPSLSYTTAAARVIFPYLPYRCVAATCHRAFESLACSPSISLRSLRTTSTMSETAKASGNQNDWINSSKPIRAMAPMTEMGDLPFRLLCRRYGADVCYTPMMYAKHFSEHERYRRENFETCSEDHPLIAQFCVQ